MKRELKLRVVVISVFAFALTISEPLSHAADDWEAVDTSINQQSTGPTRRISANREAERGKTAGTAPVVVCGEAGRPASAPIESMVAKIDRLWRVDLRVYETIEPEPPHSAPGGCIFYNRRALAAIMVGRLDVNDQSVVNPLLWAIFAHEAGHQIHHDFDSSRAAVPAKTKELEADRLAGYTLAKLGVRATDLTPFWTMAGDDFGSSSGYKHGSSAERVAAFKQGWHLAEWNQPEDSASVRSALEEPVAPDQPDAAPQ